MKPPHPARKGRSARTVGAVVAAGGVPSGARSDRGAATVWGVVTMAVLGLMCAAALGMGQAVVARHRAASAADLAALAAADSWARGPEAACAAARRVARAQGGLIEVCSIRGQISEVAARAALGPYAVRVRARAGPPGAGP